MQEEIEQLLSEKLEGLSYYKRQNSFIATIILDICYKIHDKELFSLVVNDFKAVNLLLESYLFEENDKYDYSKTKLMTDISYSDSLTKDYSSIEKLKLMENKYIVNGSFDDLLILCYVLRDRYFPSTLLNNSTFTLEKTAKDL